MLTGMMGAAGGLDADFSDERALRHAIGPEHATSGRARVRITVFACSRDLSCIGYVCYRNLIHCDQCLCTLSIRPKAGIICHVMIMGCIRLALQPKSQAYGESGLTSADPGFPHQSTSTQLKRPQPLATPVAHLRRRQQQQQQLAPSSAGAHQPPAPAHPLAA